MTHETRPYPYLSYTCMYLISPFSCHFNRILVVHESYHLSEQSASVSILESALHTCVSDRKRRDAIVEMDLVSQEYARAQLRGIHYPRINQQYIVEIYQPSQEILGTFQ